MNIKPKLTQIRKASPLRPLVDSINEAIRDQSVLNLGPGLGMSDRGIYLSGQNYMVGVTDANGIPATTIAGATRTLGVGDVYEQTIDYNGNDILLVPAGPDAVTTFTCVNPSLLAVSAYTLIIAQKLFGLWFVVWEDCGGSGVTLKI